MKQRQYSPIERTYAEALLGAARRLGIVQRAMEEARVLLKVVKQNPRLLLFLESPHISAQEKQELLDRVFKGRLSPLMVNLLHVLAARRRTTYLDETLELFQELVEQSEGLWRVQVTTAHELNFQDKVRLKTALEKFTKRQLKIEYNIDPRLIGGLVCRLRDFQIDASLRNALNGIRYRLLHTPLPALQSA
jgi:F-type H+-transporting ATPase subunit delta